MAAARWTVGGVALALLFSAQIGQARHGGAAFDQSKRLTLTSQIDYDDYRDVSGVKLPFTSTLTWLSGRTTFEWVDIQTNVSLPDSRFVRP